MPEAPKVLIVEDDALIATSLKWTLEDMGFDVCGCADSADEAVRLALLHRPDAVLMDVRLRGAGDGVDAAIAIHDGYAPPIIFITGSNEPATRSRIANDHPSGLLIKPILPDDLETTLHRVLASRRTERRTGD